MKATIDIPDDLYRSVKARSALEGRPLRAVAIELFRIWLEAPTAAATEAEPVPGDSEAPWLAIARKHVRPGLSHDMDSIREAIANGWGTDAGEKLRPS